MPTTKCKFEAIPGFCSKCIKPTCLDPITPSNANIDAQNAAIVQAREAKLAQPTGYGGPTNGLESGEHASNNAVYVNAKTAVVR